MKTLDAHGDDYRNAQLTMLLEVRIRQMMVSEEEIKFYHERQIAHFEDKKNISIKIFVCHVNSYWLNAKINFD